ncbi:MAG TPA: penicillin-binding protein 2 [Solirubrobacteraceae bacterium]|jgi:peptidoglycan glycosyltransferase|nr:penicillin-binding protein 2 [Solirubrobacteraceae bacterium]
MNRPIARLFGLVIVLFLLLIGFTSRWTVFEAQSLRDNPFNARGILEQQLIPRGSIRADDGSVLARSTRGKGGAYTRSYPTGDLFALPIGYSYTSLGRAGLESSRNDELTGRANVSQLNSVINQLTGHKQVGDDVYTTLDPQAQRIAVAQLAGRKGSVVALDPQTGAIKVMASFPSYDPNELRGGQTALARLTQSGQSLQNRATEAAYLPGSTFKVVTAIAAIDSGRYTPNSVLSGASPITISGVPLSNDSNEQFGMISLTQALTNSVNTVFAPVAVAVGKPTMAKYMNRLGFDAAPPIDLPRDETRASGEYLGGKLLAPTSDLVDVGRMGIGQDKLEVTPLQMAMVAAAVANHGTLMTPHLTDKVIDKDGRTVERVNPTVFSQVMSTQTATEVGEMMSHVVNDGGTGTAAALPGIVVAGKTGTAQLGTGTSLNQVSFIAFAPLVNPRIAIAVTVERATGQGGTVAAPIAKAVLQSLLGAG